MAKHRVTHVRSLVVSVVALIAACGGGGGEGPRNEAGAQSDAVDACTLLTEAEIGAALGIAVGSPRPAMSGGVISICQWPRAPEAEPFLPFFQLSVTPNAAASYDAWMAAMARDLGEPLDPAENRRVDGIGDWAVYVEDTRTLLIGRGSRLVHVMVERPSGEAETAVLGRLAVGRLGS